MKNTVFATICGVFSMLICSCSEKAPPKNALKQSDRKLVAAWYEAVSQNRVQDALKNAKKLVDCSKIAAKTPESYANLARKEKINPKFFTEKFNYWDFKRWQSAVFFKELSDQLCKGHTPAEYISVLLKAVNARVSNQSLDKEIVPWPVNVWKHRHGKCDRQSWLLCELAAQQNYDSAVVYLIKPGTYISPHTVCELRKGSSIFFADPYCQKMLDGISTYDLGANKELLEKVWPDKDQEKYREAAANLYYWIPAYVQDYCPRNQLLARKVGMVMKEKAPIFGCDPDQRLARYRGLMGFHTIWKVRLSLWFLPFRYLYTDIVRTIERQKKQKLKDQSQ